MRTVLLVEDDDAIRGCIAEGLGMAGYKVVAVSTTTEALTELDADRVFELAVRARGDRREDAAWATRMGSHWVVWRDLNDLTSTSSS
jgi:CheY-like chemotaxis protein